jgi:hypothetical protein
VTEPRDPIETAGRRHPSLRRRLRLPAGGLKSWFGISVVGCLITTIVVIAMPVFSRPGTPKPASVAWGVTFSQKASRDFGLDWQANYLSIVNDLKPSGLRLVAYWDLVEPTPGHYDFRDLDWQFDQAEKAGIPVILVVGQKVPRWPEYHFPRWLDPQDARERKARLLEYLPHVVEHYRSRRTLIFWQVENEPFLSFGRGLHTDVTFLAKEIALVRKTDPRHKILETDGGEWGGWAQAAKLGDAFGTSLYRHVYRRGIGSITPSRTPEYYAQKARETRRVVGRPDEEVICAELQAEPWGSTLNYKMTLDQQLAFFPEQTFADNIDFARKTGLTKFYLWGAEWWYYLKLHGHPEYWEHARQVIQEG